MMATDKLTNLGNVLRDKYGTTDKYSLSDMAKMIKGLEIHNLIDDGQYFDTTKGDSEYKILNGLDIATCQKYVGKTILISFDINWSGYQNISSNNNRTGIEYGIKFKNSPELWSSAWLYPDSSSGTKHVCAFYKLPNDEVTEIEEGCYFNQVNNDAMIKATNIKIIVDPLGGVVPPNLFDIAGMKLTNANRDGTLFTFEDHSNPNGIVYTDFLVQNNIPLKKNTAYQLSFSVRGTGTIVTYVYGNNSSGKYIDNGHWWGLTNQWQEFQQYLPPESVPLNANFNFRSATNCSGEVTNLKLTPVE